MFARFVNGRVAGCLLPFRNGDCALDLLAANPTQIFAKRFALP